MKGRKMMSNEKKAVRLEDEALDEVSGGIGFEFSGEDEGHKFPVMYRCPHCRNDCMIFTDGKIVCLNCGFSDSEENKDNYIAGFQGIW